MDLALDCERDLDDRFGVVGWGGVAFGVWSLAASDDRLLCERLLVERRFGLRRDLDRARFDSEFSRDRLLRCSFLRELDRDRLDLDDDDEDESDRRRVEANFLER